MLTANNHGVPMIDTILRRATIAAALAYLANVAALVYLASVCPR